VKKLSTAFMAAAAIAATVFAPTASANIGPIPTVGASAAHSCGTGEVQTCTGAGQLAPIGLGSASAFFTCSATTPFAVQATTVRCWIQHKSASGSTVYFANAPAPSVTTTGNEAVTNGVYDGVLNPFVVLQDYELCIQAGYIDLAGTTHSLLGHCSEPI
jgi:hypothetical protein